MLALRKPYCRYATAPYRPTRAPRHASPRVLRNILRCPLGCVDSDRAVSDETQPGNEVAIVTTPLTTTASLFNYTPEDYARALATILRKEFGVPFAVYDAHSGEPAFPIGSTIDSAPGLSRRPPSLETFRVIELGKAGAAQVGV